MQHIEPFVAVDSGHPDVLKLRGRDWLAMPHDERERVLVHCHAYWRSHGFPYPQLTADHMRAEYRAVLRTDVASLWREGCLGGSTVGLRLANSFHPQMWRVRCRQAHSPHERFHDDTSLPRLLRHALSIWPERYAVNASNLRAMLRTFSKTTRVSNFRPVVAKAIIARYSPERAHVLDFSAGYGGRLLGCMTLSRRYFGIDPSHDQTRGNRAMLDALGSLVPLSGAPELWQDCAEDLMPSLARNSFHLVFSSPPYFNLERYSDEPSQSYRRYPRYAIWREKFLAKVILESARVLKRRGFLVINAASVNGYSIAEDCLEYGRACLTLVDRFALRLARKPYLRASPEHLGKHEPVFVFQKR